MARTVEFFGDTFELNDTVSEIALMEFAEAASNGLDADLMEGLAALLRIVKSCIAPRDLKRFMVVARKNHAKSEHLVPILQATMAEVTERPTGLPSDSSDGQPTTELKSVSSSVDRGLERLSGRPDLQLAVVRQRAS